MLYNRQEPLPPHFSLHNKQAESMICPNTIGEGIYAERDQKKQSNFQKYYAQNFIHSLLSL
jgi:hypothetical protein